MLKETIGETIGLMCFCAIILLIFFVIIFLINYEVYVSNNLSEADDKRYEYDFASLKEYESIVNSLDIKLYTFYIEPNYTINESHIIFDERIMILYPISYFKFIRRLHNKTKRRRKRIKGLWKGYLK